MNINSTINSFLNNKVNVDIVSNYNANNKLIHALQIYLKNEYSEYYKSNNLEKIFILAENDIELQEKLLKSINRFVVM